MTKKQLLDAIKDRAKGKCCDPLFLYYKGDNIACLEFPDKGRYETIKQYLEHFDIAPRGKGVYLLAIKFSYRGGISILIDGFGGL